MPIGSLAPLLSVLLAEPLPFETRVAGNSQFAFPRLDDLEGTRIVQLRPLHPSAQIFDLLAESFVAETDVLRLPARGEMLAAAIACGDHSLPMLDGQFDIDGFVQAEMCERLAPTLATVRQVALLNLQASARGTQPASHLQDALIVGLCPLEIGGASCGERQQLAVVQFL